MSNNTLPRITVPSPSILLTPEPLTPSSFSPFGTAIFPPLPQHVRCVPHDVQIPSPLYPSHQPPIVSANQNTALKTSPISPLLNNYPSPSPSQPEAKGLMSIFSCFPRRNTYLDPRSGKLRLRLEILERHPYTSQTFCPLNFSSGSSSSSTNSRSGVVNGGGGDQSSTYFLVIVAPTVHDPKGTPVNPPDLTRARAFVAPVTVDGGLGMAVTYAPGTWHAPMVVLGDRRVDFLVSQFANGVALDDCQEVLVGRDFGGKGSEGGEDDIVEVDLRGLGLGPGSEKETEGLWKAKL